MKIRTSFLLLLFVFCHQLYPFYDPSLEINYNSETGSTLLKDLKRLKIDLNKLNFDDLIDLQDKIQTAYSTLIRDPHLAQNPINFAEDLEKHINKAQKAYDNLMKWIKSKLIVPTTRQDVFNQPTKKTPRASKTSSTIVPHAEISSNTINITNFAKHGFDNDSSAVKAIQINTRGKVWVIDNTNQKRKTPNYDLVNFPANFKTYDVLSTWIANNHFLVTKSINSDDVTIKANVNGVGGGKKRHHNKKKKHHYKKNESSYISTSYFPQIKEEFEQAQKMYRSPVTDERIQKAIGKFVLICNARLEHLDNLKDFVRTLSKESFVSFYTDVTFVNKNILLSDSQKEKLMETELNTAGKQGYIDGINGDKKIYHELLSRIPTASSETHQQLSQHDIDTIIEFLNEHLAYEEFECAQRPSWDSSLDSSTTTSYHDTLSSPPSEKVSTSASQFAEIEQELPILRKLDEIVKHHASPARANFDQIVKFGFIKANPLSISSTTQKSKKFKDLEEWKTYIKKIGNNYNFIKRILGDVNYQTLLQDPIFIKHTTTLQQSKKLLKSHNDKPTIMPIQADYLTANNPLNIFEARLYFAHLASYLRDLEKKSIPKKHKKTPTKKAIVSKEPVPIQTHSEKLQKQTEQKTEPESQNLLLEQQKYVKPIPETNKHGKEEEELVVVEPSDSRAISQNNEYNDYPHHYFPFSSSSTKSTHATYKTTKTVASKSQSANRINLPNLTTEQLSLMEKIFQTPDNELKVKDLVQLVLDLKGKIKPMGGSVISMTLPQGAFVLNNIQEADMPQQSSKSSASIHTKHGKGARNDRKSLAHGVMVRQFKSLFTKAGITGSDLNSELEKRTLKKH